MIRIRQLKVEVTLDSRDYLLKAISKKLKVSTNHIKDFSLKRQSLDARNKNEIYYNVWWRL